MAGLRKPKSRSGKFPMIAIVAVAGACVVLFQNCGKIENVSGLNIKTAKASTIALLGLDEKPAEITGGDEMLRQPGAGSPTTWMVPNQMASAVWLRKDNGSPINGHIEESFGQFQFWPKLAERFGQGRGGLGIYASEIGFMTDDTLLAFRRRGIALSVEAPAMEQCLDGQGIARAELQGYRVNGVNIFSENYQITDDSRDGGWNPGRGGWFVTRNGHRYAPEEVVLVARLPKVLPSYDVNGNLIQDPCPESESFNKGVDRLSGLINDYVEYALELKTVFPKTPKLSLIWPVNAKDWETKDLECLRKLGGNQTAYDKMSAPCYFGVSALERVVAALCGKDSCPSTIYMKPNMIAGDGVDNAAYSLEMLRRSKKVLSQYGVALGINLINPNRESTKTIEEQSGQLVIADRMDGGGRHDLDAWLNLASFLKRNEVIGSATPLRIQSRQAMPVETNDDVHEDNPGSFANTVMHILKDVVEAPVAPLAQAVPAAPAESNEAQNAVMAIPMGSLPTN